MVRKCRKIREMKRRVGEIGRWLPTLVRAAQSVHRTEGEVKAAVLLAWAALAGVAGWTPEMVAKVERELGRE